MEEVVLLQKAYQEHLAGVQSPAKGASVDGGRKRTYRKRTTKRKRMTKRKRTRKRTKTLRHKN
jgi:hypothetical protein